MTGSVLGPHRRRRARGTFLVASVLFATVMLAAVEVLLRLMGIGDPVPWTASRLAYQHYAPPILRPARRSDGTEILRTVDARLPFQSVLAHKPADSLRVFCFGGSATAGLGFSPNVTFSRSLGDMLQVALPDRRVEVLNFGTVAFSSAQVRGMVAEACERYAPDVVIVYCGNNEFLETHARKYADTHGDFGRSIGIRVADTNLYRSLLRLRGPPLPWVVTESTESDLRLSETELIDDIAMTADEVTDVLSAYETNLQSIAKSASGHGVSLLLMTVASNWAWHGRSDLPPTRLVELTQEAADVSPSAEQLRQALAELDERLTDLNSPGRHEVLFQRAVLHEALGAFEAARADYRAAMNADPRRRRASDSINEVVASVATRAGVGFYDTVGLLAATAEHGIVGFGEFYDYVHFTPRGCLLVAAGLFEHMRRTGLVSPASSFDPKAFVGARLDELAGRTEDYLESRRWMGFCEDPDMLVDRDLWKYDKMLASLDDRIAADGADVRALIWRGNARSFQQDGAAGAAADYRAALALRPDMEPARVNLERLLSERPAFEAESLRHGSPIARETALK